MSSASWVRKYFVSRPIASIAQTAMHRARIRLRVTKLEDREVPAAAITAHPEPLTATGRSLVLVADDLRGQIPASELAGSDVVAIRRDGDAIGQISAALAGRRELDCIRIISHGSAGQIALGQGGIDAATIKARSAEVQAWSRSLAPGADILVYGCNVAGSADGRAFVQSLAKLTGADVAASTNVTGRGGDTTLEFATGTIEHRAASAAKAWTTALPLLPNQRAESGLDFTGTAARNLFAFAALKSDSSITAWGYPSLGGTGAPTGTGFTQIYSSQQAFAALKSDGSITAWGYRGNGGTGAPTGTGFTQIFSNYFAFAALKSDGSITAWGDSLYGGAGAPIGTGFTQIFSTDRAFATLKADGSITAWGDSLYGGAGAPIGTGFTQIFSTRYAFAALKPDGSIASWGDSYGAGAPTGTGFTRIFSGQSAFAALKSDGSIAAWGNSVEGGTGAPTGTGFTQIFSNYGAFAALKSDGSIAAWGNSGSGGTGAPPGTGFTQIFSNGVAFAGLKSDGSIAAWGNSSAGGSGAPTGTGFTQIYSNSRAFAAFTSDGTITVWGDSTYGGTGAPTGTGFTQIFSTDRAFATLKADGSITAWGYSSYGGTGAPTGTGFRTIQSVKNFAPYFEPPQSTSFTATYGVAFSQTVRVVSLDTVTFSISSGSLPTGLSLNSSTGTISGTPTVGGSFNFTIQAANGVSPNATQAFSMTVNQAPAITSGNSTTFTVGSAGSFTVTATGTPAPSFSVTSGSLPLGVTLNGTTGLLSGTPAARSGGTYALTIQAANGFSPNATQSFTLAVNEAPAITSGNIFNMKQGVAGSLTVTASGFPTPTFSIASGSLPSGMSLNSATGVIGGTPAAGSAGNYSFTVTATNSLGSASQTIQAQVFGSLLPNQRSGSGGLYTGVAVRNVEAFAALQSDGSIAAWGYSSSGGTGAPTGTGFTQLFSTFNAFSALKSDGSITAWGSSSSGGTGAPTGTGFAQLFSTGYSFTSLKSDGSITAWGDGNTGGSGAPTGTGFTQIFSNPWAFAALKSDGSITAWGNAAYGGAGAPTGTGFTQIFSASNAFAALKSDGSIAAWGGSGGAGAGIPTGTGFTQIFSTSFAFAALKIDGSIQAWSSSSAGGTGAPTSTGFTQLFSTDRAFAALKSDGSITAWGDVLYGGSWAPTGTGFTQIFSTQQAFAALKSDGSITAWGNAGYGSTGAPTSTGFTQIFSTGSAFAASSSNGTIASWGDSSLGGTGAPTGTGFRTIQSVKNFAPYFEPPQSTSFTATFGVAFSQTVRVVSLDTVTYSISSGSLPAGLSLNSSTGTISGTPTVGGSFNFTIQAANGVSPNATQAFSMTVNQAPAITSGNVFNMLQGVAGSLTVAASGTPAPTFGITSGTLPSGMTLNSTTGVISGTPAAGSDGNYSFTVTATNAAGSASQTILGQVFGKLLPDQQLSSYIPWSGAANRNDYTFASLKPDGSVLAWGNPVYGATGAPSGTGFTQIFSTSTAFAALTPDGSITTWGNSGSGGTGAPTGTGFSKVSSTSGAFAALRPDGGIQTWGYPNYGGTGSPTDTGYTQIFSNPFAFVAMKADGSVRSWGINGNGGAGAPTGTGFTQVFSNQFAFAAIRSDGSIQVWGTYASGVPSGVGFTQVVASNSSTSYSMAALKNDGSIVTWGNALSGGTGAPTGGGFRRIFATPDSYAAIRFDGSIFSWGNAASGGTGAPTGTGFTQVFASATAFAAIKGDGSIAAWGDSTSGGTGAPSGVGFTRIIPNAWGFAALRADGGIATWGNASYGGTGGPTGTGFTQIFATTRAFSALNIDGSIRAWGAADRGGTGAPSGTGFRTIQSVKNFAPYFEPPQPTSFTAMAGSAFSQTVRVVSLDTVTYSVKAGSLPTGLTLNTSTGTISGTPTVAGTFNFTIQAANGMSPNATQAFSILVNQMPAPAVALVKVNDGSIQRSMVKSVTVTFNSVVSFAGSVASAFQLSRQGGGNVGGFSATANVVNGVTVVTLSNFTGSQTQFGSLANGFYTLTVLASQVSNSGGAMASNYTLVGNSTNKFFRYYGDLDGNASVDGDDLAIFVSTLFNPGNYVVALDYDNNGSIDGDDLALFVQNLFVPL